MGRNLASVSSIQKIDTHEVFGLDKDVSNVVIDTEVINEQQKDENAASKEGVQEEAQDVKNQTSQQM